MSTNGTGPRPMAKDPTKARMATLERKTVPLLSPIPRRMSEMSEAVIEVS